MDQWYTQDIACLFKEVPMKGMTFGAVLLSSILLFAPPVHDKLKLADPITHGKRTKKIALTFDDGPNPESTSQLVHLAKAYGEISLFVSGNAAARYPELIREAAGLGHRIGIHGYSHRMMSQLTWQQQKEELEKSADTVQDILGERPLLFRPPWGSYNEQTQELLTAKGMHLVNWEVDSQDFTSLSNDGVVERVLAQAKPGSIILFHDADEFGHPRKRIVDLLPDIFERLSKQGYQFVTVDELIEEDEAVGDPADSFSVT